MTPPRSATRRRDPGRLHRCYRGFVEAFLNVSKRFRSGEMTALAAMPAWCFPPPLLFRDSGDTLELDNLPLPDPAPT